MKIVNVVGARPNLMKIGLLMEAYRGWEEIEPLLVHAGQHYDANMSDLFFRRLGIPEPEINRVLTDSISDLLLCLEPSGAQNGRAAGRIVEVLVEAL